MSHAQFLCAEFRRRCRSRISDNRSRLESGPDTWKAQVGSTRPAWRLMSLRHIGPRLHVPQQREVTHRFMIMRFRSGATPTAIIPRRSASLMAARTFALPTLARSAIRATGRVHFPVAAASFRMTASTAIASVFRCSPIEGGTTTVAARNRRPHATRWTVSDLLLFSAIRVSILD
jgi:hypothetical protein